MKLLMAVLAVTLTGCTLPYISRAEMIAVDTVEFVVEEEKS